MKLLTKEEEDAHYRATLQGGILGGLSGLALGTLGVLGASRRYPVFNNSLTLQMKAFLVTSGGTFAGIIAADHASRGFESSRNPADQARRSREQDRKRAEISGMTWTERAMDWGRKERYKIVGVGWVVSMAASFALVSRNKYLTGQQKLVQARVYAQALTVAVLIASAGLEVSDSRQDRGKFEMVEYVDDQNHKQRKMVERSGGDDGGEDGDPLWKEMVRSEEQRLRERDEAIKKMEQRDHKKKSKQKQHHRHSTHDDDRKKHSDQPANDGNNNNDGSKTDQQHQEQSQDEDGDKRSEISDTKEEKGEKKVESEEAKEEEDEDDDDDEPHPIPGKVGEGKMMHTATDPPEPGASAVP